MSDNIIGGINWSDPMFLSYIKTGKLVWMDTPKAFYEAFIELGLTQEQLEDAVERGNVIFHQQDDSWNTL